MVVWTNTLMLAASTSHIPRQSAVSPGPFLDGHLQTEIDPRGIETRYEYDSRGRRTNERQAYGTTVEARTETLYDAASNVIESRFPRYFDSSDTNGYLKAKETWTYNGRGKVRGGGMVKRGAAW